jgi:hypothetical protein
MHEQASFFFFFNENTCCSEPSSTKSDKDLSLGLPNCIRRWCEAGQPSTAILPDIRSFVASIEGVGHRSFE